ncbi:MAG: folate family ECF transporter S component [Clostridia bacterium]|nr:folate family ECF transporter S component [Clostridia bacterium]MBR5015799.1 folate family ECF transporter S component [Clostridia bacterium]MBR5976285.1 folate family ECF transporter S component [Clostridia bacterium]
MNNTFKDDLKEQFSFNTYQIVIMGMLIALYVVLNRFLSINVWNLSIGLTFLPLAVAGMVLGPVKAGIVGALSDFIGAMLFPFGPFFPGFTLTAFLKGLTYGLLLYKKQNILLIVAAEVIVQGILSLFLQSYWISYLYGSPYWAVVTSRFVQVGPLFVVETLLIFLLSKSLVPTLKDMISEKQNKPKA